MLHFTFSTSQNILFILHPIFNSQLVESSVDFQFFQNTKNVLVFILLFCTPFSKIYFKKKIIEKHMTI